MWFETILQIVWSFLTTWWFGIVLGVIAIIWVRRSVKIVGPDERAVLVIFGKPIDIRDSGWVFNLRFPLPGCYLKKFPTKVYNLAFPTREVITKAGEYNDVEYGAQVLKVRLVIYTRFPSSKDQLIEAFKARVPTEESALMDFFEEIAVGSLRVVLGNMTWRETIEQRNKIRSQTEKAIQASKMFKKTGFSKAETSLVIQEIELPPGLERALPTMDIQRLEMEASKYEASQVATETVGTAIQMMAKSRGIKPEDVQEKINKSTKMQREFLELAKDLIVREMGSKRGAYLDIRVGGVESKGEGAGKGFIEKVTEAIIAIVAAYQNMPKGKSEGKENRRTGRIATKEGVKREEQRLKEIIRRSSRRSSK